MFALLRFDDDVHDLDKEMNDFKQYP